MAYLRGKGAFSNRSLIVTSPKAGIVYEDKTKKDVIKGRFLDVQVDQSLMNPDKVREGKGPEAGKETKSGAMTIAPQTNPHLVSNEVDHPNGGTYVNHRTYYTEEQYQSMAKAAGKKSFKTDKGDQVLGIQANLTKNAKNELIVNTAKPMSATRNPYFGKNVLKNQDAVTKAAREFRDVQREAKHIHDGIQWIQDFRDAQREAKQAEAEAPQMDAAEAQMDDEQPEA